MHVVIRAELTIAVNRVGVAKLGRSRSFGFAPDRAAPRTRQRLDAVQRIF
jgi:hypothetical protein